MTPDLIQDFQIVVAICRLCSAAERDLLIVQYAFRSAMRPRREMKAVIQAIRAAADRGVKVTILLNRPSRPRRPGPNIGTLGRVLKHDAIRILFASGARILHTKALLADGHLLLIGSHNFSQLSFSTSRNISVLIDDPLLGRRCAAAVAPLIESATSG
jgi:phosphatidylserine/phosphatidylglycerophosphate/cardiolipin synthase-like enzyme